MAESTAVKNLRDLTITFEDGTGSPLSYVLAYEPGDLSISVGGVTVEEYLDRGKHASPPALRTVTDGNCSITISAYFRDYHDASDEVLGDLLAWLSQAASGTGAVGSWVSTLGASAEVHTCTFKVAIASVNGDTAETLSFPYLQVDTYDIGDGSPATFKMSGTSRATHPTVA